MDEESLFATAVGQPPGPGREAFLDEACGGSAAMRDRVARLLAANDRSGASSTPRRRRPIPAAPGP